MSVFDQKKSDFDKQVNEARQNMHDRGQAPARAVPLVTRFSSDTCTGKVSYNGRDKLWVAEITYVDGSEESWESASKDSLMVEVMRQIGQVAVDEAARTEPWHPVPLRKGQSIEEGWNEANDLVHSTNFCRACKEYKPTERNAELMLSELRKRGLAVTNGNLFLVFDILYQTPGTLDEWEPVTPPVVERIPLPAQESATEQRERGEIMARLHSLPIEIGTRQELDDVTIESLRSVLAAAEQELRTLRKMKLKDLGTQVRSGYRKQHRPDDPRI